jgi:hypothetical protein
LIQEPPPAPEPPPEPAPEPSPEPTPKPTPEQGDPLVFFTNALATARVGKAYRQRLVVQGGTPPYMWNVIGLPQRLHLRGGVITGRPKRAGRFVFVVRVSDAAAAQASDKLLLLVKR